MVLSQPFNLSFYGKLKIEDKKLTDWSGLAAAKNIKGDKYNFSALKMEGQMKDDGSSILKAYSPAGEFSKDAEVIRWIEPTNLGQEWAEGIYKFREFSVKIEVYPDKSMSWKRGYARLENGWQLSSEGTLNENKLTAFWLQWDKPNQQFMNWTHPGPFLSEGWVPQTPWVREWLAKNPDFLSKYPSIRFVNSEEEVKTQEKQNENTKDQPKDALSNPTKEKPKGS